MAAAACPKCDAEEAVEFDLVQGVSACMSCGAVLDEELLVHPSAFDDQGARTGTFVGAADTGEVAAAYALHSSGAGLAIQRSKRGGGEGKAKARVREFCALLQVQPAVTDQAVHVLEQAAPHLLGSWRRDLLAAAVTYSACRLNSLPLTLADLSSATQIEPCTLGRHYCTVCRLLDLQPPLLLAADLLPRCLDRVTAEAVRGGTLTAAQVGMLRRDTNALLGWMAAQMERQPAPLSTLGAALVLAAEMNTVSLSLDHICSSLDIRRSTLERALSATRTRLVQLAAFLPYADSINQRNVGSHARMIMQLSALVGGSPRGGDSGGGSGDGSAAGDASEKGQQQQQREQQPQPQPQPPPQQQQPEQQPQPQQQTQQQHQYQQQLAVMPQQPQKQQCLALEEQRQGQQASSGNKRPRLGEPCAAVAAGQPQPGEAATQAIA